MAIMHGILKFRIKKIRSKTNKINHNRSYLCFNELEFGVQLGHVRVISHQIVVLIKLGNISLNLLSEIFGRIHITLVLDHAQSLLKLGIIHLANIRLAVLLTHRLVTLLKKLSNVALSQDSRGKASALNGHLTQQSFLIGLLQYVLLDRFLTDQSVYVDVAGLTDPVTPVLSLCVHCRIPVRVIEHDCVSARQINAHAARSRAQYETKYPAVRIEAFHEHLTLFDGRGAVQPQVLVAVIVQKVL
ncbi:hypothetical protein BpHYR1_027376 [Brachionus plicatilis]|uniref:Uncharacterized protein n=1 Tax=Brachionus plicatilis TaxID=10195 RepID=A0A3M7RNC4_BRAPC|nr:hypothetical protein BpHYR1_027376 [Brachionus plicatilis]